MYYYNMIGQCYVMPELPLEPPDVWSKESYETEDGEEVAEEDD